MGHLSGSITTPVAAVGREGGCQPAGNKSYENNGSRCAGAETEGGIPEYYKVSKHLVDNLVMKRSKNLEIRAFFLHGRVKRIHFWHVLVTKKTFLHGISKNLFPHYI